MTCALLTVLSFIFGVIAHAAWTYPDIKELKRKAYQGEIAQRRYASLAMKVMRAAAQTAGVEIDPDEF